MSRWSAYVCGSAVVVTFGSLLAAQAPAFKRTILQQVDLSAPGREAVMAHAEFPPGTETGRHTHPGEEVSYVEAGPLLLEVDGQPTRTFQTGEAFMVPAGVIHNARAGSAPITKVVATYIIEKGKPASTPAPAK